jgi:hypothetical protein
MAGHMPKAKVRKKHDQRPKRLVPKADVLRSVYLLSGNVCAYPGCTNVLINRDGVMIGEICHIEAAEAGGPRFNHGMTNEERRAASNLLMLCANHHAVIDGRAPKYTVAKLKKIKREHEAKFAEIDERLQQRFVDQFRDHTDSLAPTYPKTMAGLTDLIKSTAPIPEVVKEIGEYINRLSKVPDNERQFLLALIRRAEKLGWQRAPGFLDGVRVSVSTEDIRSALSISNGKITRLSEAFERYGIGGLSESGEGHWNVYASGLSDYVGWFDIVQFADKHGIDLERFVLHLEFGRLDQAS